MKYDLVGISGNAFSIIGYVINSMRECRISQSERDLYFKDALSGDYNNLLCISFDMIDLCNKIASPEEF